MPVAAKLQRQPKRISSRPSSGTPAAGANFDAASKMAVERLRSRAGNQYPTALELAGNVGASPTPRRRRAAKKLPTPVAAAAPKDATLQRKVLKRPTSFTPKRSSSTPQGSCSAA